MLHFFLGISIFFGSGDGLYGSVDIFITSSKLAFIASLVSYLPALFFFAFALLNKVTAFLHLYKGNPHNTLGGHPNPNKWHVFRYSQQVYFCLVEILTIVRF
jgi:hypothetical protein